MSFIQQLHCLIARAEKALDISSLKSGALRVFVQTVLKAQRRAKEIENQLRKKHGDEFFTSGPGPLIWTELTDKHCANQQFEDLKILKNVRVVHFTDSDPLKLIDAIKKGKFRGCQGKNMSGTRNPENPPCVKGPLGFGFTLKEAKNYVNDYGKYAISFIADEAIQALHYTDSEIQVIWDSRYVRDLKVAHEFSS